MAGFYLILILPLIIIAALFAVLAPIITFFLIRMIVIGITIILGIVLLVIGIVLRIKSKREGEGKKKTASTVLIVISVIIIILSPLSVFLIPTKKEKDLPPYEPDTTELICLDNAQNQNPKCNIII